MSDDTEDSASNALLGLGDIVKDLQNNSADGQYNDAAQDEFLRLSKALRQRCDALENVRFISDTDAINTAASNLQSRSGEVKAHRQDLENIAQKFEVVSQFLALLDDALVIAAAFRP